MWNTLACDWLQFCGEVLQPFPSSGGILYNYKFELTTGHTRVFKKVAKVYERASVTASHRDELIFTVCYEPFSAILRANLCQLKVENRILYELNMVRRVSQACETFGIKFNNFTRIDIACDFVTFENGMDPISFLTLFLKGKIIKKGSRKFNLWGIASHSSSQLKHYTETWSKDKHEYYCCSWGGCNSDVHVKMYNKSKEIRDSCNELGVRKLYIKRFWRENGLTSKADVWRVEFSVTRRAMNIVDTQTGEVGKIGLGFLQDYSILAVLFSKLCDKHFKWFDIRGCVSKTKVPELELFSLPTSNSFCFIQPKSEKMQQSRSIKAMLNNIKKIAEQLDLKQLAPASSYGYFKLWSVYELLSQVYEGVRKWEFNNNIVPVSLREQICKEFALFSKGDIRDISQGGLSCEEIAYMNMISEQIEEFRKDLECSYRSGKEDLSNWNLH